MRVWQRCRLEPRFDELAIGQAYLDRTSNIDSPRYRCSWSRVGHCSLGRRLSWRIRNYAPTRRLSYWSVERHLKLLASLHPPGTAHRWTRVQLMGRSRQAASVGGPVQRSLLNPRQRLRRVLRSCAVNQVWPKSAPCNVIPIEISRRLAVGKTDFEAAAKWHGFVGNDADAIGHRP
jgi:hypothetical protein